ncbi:MAG: SRPBCC family protein [Acidobacteriia bacterium]|nr:SRPBCC family protein [Terriglobia bacterium]
MAGSELSRIEKKIVIRAPRERVWRAIANIEEFSRWFGVETSGTFAPGARVEMTSTQEGCRGVAFWVEIEEMTPGRRLSWRWLPGMPEPGVDYSQEPATVVTFQLDDAPEGTLVTVVESGFDAISLARRAKVFEENEKGWEFQLKSLDKYAGPAV